MIKKIYKCVICGGNVYPCILTEKSKTKSLCVPIKCPFGFEEPKWEEVKK